MGQPLKVSTHLVSFCPDVLWTVTSDMNIRHVKVPCKCKKEVCLSARHDVGFIRVRWQHVTVALMGHYMWTNKCEISSFSWHVGQLNCQDLQEQE